MPSAASVTDFTGFWKWDCGDAWGVQIKRLATGDKYSVAFCGPGGCDAPGQFLPNTKIEGDLRYRVIDSTTLEFRRGQKSMMVK